MPSIIYLSLRIAFFACLLANTLFVSSIPLQRQDTPGLTQVTSWSPDNSNHDSQAAKDRSDHLPPVSDVFKIMADADPNAPQVMMPKVLSQSISRVSASDFISEFSFTPLSSSTATPSDPAPSVTTSVLAPTTPSPSYPVSTYFGPGIMIASTLALSPETTPTPMSPGSVASKHANSDNNSTKSKSALATRKVIVIGVVLVSIIVLIFLVYVLDYRLFSICRGTRKKDESQAWAKVASPLQDSGDYSEKRTTAEEPAWMLSSIFSPSRRGRGAESDANSKVPLTHDIDSEPQVVDISDPHSRFSESSSEYPTSAESCAQSPQSARGPNRSNSSHLPAYEFCSLLSTAESLEDNHHTRVRSSPVFGHEVSTDRPGMMVRPGEHRRSRSVSGLTYTLDPSEYRNSGSSSISSEWKESPPNFSGGWPTAH